jgi:protein-disulfide isomerase
MEEHEHKVEHPEEVHHHIKKKEKELSVPMAIIFGAFIIAIAIIVVKMPQRGTVENNDPNKLDNTTVKSMVNHVLETKNENPVVPVSITDHIIGSTNPKVTLIEYSDFECPFCKNFDLTMQKVIKNYGNNVAWVYRHFPLDCVDNPKSECTVLHSKARHEAVASECAFEQGGNDAFWKYTTKIFSITPSNNRLDPAQLIDVAQDLKLDLVKFNACLSTDKYADVVSNNTKAGMKSNVTGTPSTIIIDRLGNTYTISGAYPYEVVSGVIDAVIKN